jgi:multicomponent Na+:H+ antiporter subunit E
MILALFVYWLVLSGHYTLWLIGAGLICTVLIVAFTSRMGCIDDESIPIRLIPSGLIYWPWLALEIVKSAIDVTKLIIRPSLPISPTMVRIKAHQDTAVGLTTYANSITLTPGTISVEVSERNHEIFVHAISTDSAAGLEDGEMGARVARFEKGPG